MESTNIDNKDNELLARNTIFMAIRMVIVLVLQLYTTRVVLSALGVVDYGIYNVTCGFVALFSFLNTAMSNGIQRFYNYELGKNGEEGAVRVFNAALRIQAAIAIVIVFAAEIIGVWYISNKMVMPLERLTAALWIFQFALLSFAVVIMEVPFDALVNAKQRMDFFALMSILRVILLLIVALSLPYISYDKLIIYGLSFPIVQILILGSYYYYTHNKFREIIVLKNIDKSLLRSMLGFSGWNLLGTFSGMLREQGLDIVLNFFCGPIVNAARAVANQVNGGLQSFVQNLTVPVRPQVVQSYAKGDLKRTMHLTFCITKLSCGVLYIVALPIMLEVNFILKIWLKDNIPTYTSIFVIIIVITSFLANVSSALSGVVHASGKMKWYQISGVANGALTILVAYIILNLGYKPYWALIASFIVALLVQIVAFYIVKTIVSFSLKEYCVVVLLPLFMYVAITIPIPLIIHFIIAEGWIRLFSVIFISILISSIGCYFILLNKQEKEIAKSLIRNLTNRLIVKRK